MHALRPPGPVGARAGPRMGGMQPQIPSTEIRIAAALITRRDGHTLLVRKRGTQAFMQPGGKIDAGESPRQALRRELLEELGLLVPETALQALGTFEAPAANEPGCTVKAELFRLSEPLEAAHGIRPAAEIEELLWLAPGQTPERPLAPLTARFVLPLLASS